VHVWDADGRKYVDLTAAFGVAAAGHANARVVRAGQRQMATLLHAMGDVHPHALKGRLARELSGLTFERWSRTSAQSNATAGAKRRALAREHGKVLFCNSGFEAVEAALKTALLATGKPGVIAFTGAYHGTGYGTLNATHREEFRGPFRSQLAAFGQFVPFPTRESELDAVLTQVERHLRRGKIGAVLVEPVQGRAGIRLPPVSFLGELRCLCVQHGALLVFDEVFTGFGRTGAWFACEYYQTVPDVICLGKALTGGFPLSACVGRADVMDVAWPASKGEAIHTSTYLGHPVGCAMALAQIEELRRLELVEQSRRLGAWLVSALQAGAAQMQLPVEVRGLGLMAGVELLEKGGAATKRAWWVIKTMLERGYLQLPEGARGHVLSFTPPLVLTQRQLARAVNTFCEVLQDSSRRPGRFVEVASRSTAT
jgi:acetylornithine/succinyldiaminopimelate/putrescine aminotransferase